MITLSDLPPENQIEVALLIADQTDEDYPLRTADNGYRQSVEHTPARDTKAKTLQTLVAMEPGGAEKALSVFLATLGSFPDSHSHPALGGMVLIPTAGSSTETSTVIVEDVIVGLEPYLDPAMSPRDIYTHVPAALILAEIARWGGLA